MRILLACHAQVNATTASGISPLMLASKYGNVDGVKQLLAAQTDGNAQTTKGETALSHAAGDPAIQALLEQAGAGLSMDTQHFG